MIKNKQNQRESNIDLCYEFECQLWYIFPLLHCITGDGALIQFY